MSSSIKKVAVIGGGAAGFFAAINCKKNYPDFQVDILEKSQKTLSKVKVSGGGRCNVTNNCMEIDSLLILKLHCLMLSPLKSTRCRS